MWVGRIIALAWVLTLAAPPVPAGEFDRVEGDVLARLIERGDGVKRRQGLSVRELQGLPAALSDTREAFVVVKTGRGNYARVLASPALRKAPEQDGPAVPVLVLERFDTFEPGRSGSRVARGSGMILFDGFQVDLDTGQVVPTGQGGDLQFQTGGKDGPEVSAVGTSVLYTLTRPLVLEHRAAGPSPGKAVIPGDFAGRFRLVADGRSAGLLELDVADDRQVTGRFRSAAKGTAYPVTGEVVAAVPNRVGFKVQFPQSEQVYDGYLATDGKNVIAGTFTRSDRTFGFFAAREGSPTVPQED